MQNIKLNTSKIVNKRKKLVYIAMEAVKRQSGVQKKILQFVNTAQKMGLDAEYKIADKGYIGRFKIAKNIFSARYDYIIFRNTLFTGLIFIIPFIVARLRGCTIIIDVPTPLRTAVNEIILNKKQSTLIRILKTSLVFVNFPLSFWPANLIVQYGVESQYFKIFSRSILVGNGIDVDAIRKRENEPEIANCPIRFISVSSITKWHGLDRLIRSMADYYKDSNKDSSSEQKKGIEVWIVGDGVEMKSLKILSKSLGVEKYVHFTGNLEGIELDKVYEKCHIAVASLALYRIDLNVASILKVREYLCKGIPIVIAADDVDLKPLPPFVFKVSNDNSILPFDKIIDWFINNWSPGNVDTIRRFAENHVAYEKKIKKILMQASSKQFMIKS